MWIFTPGGLLMPAITPFDEADPKLTLGTRTLQVRARVESHLTNFIRDYMEPMGLDYSEIEATPQMDYNFRFYTTHEEFAQAIAKAVMDIDFMKFKPTAERRDADEKLLYADGVSYHAALNNIWGAVCRLNSPGGSWGAYSTTNKNGYRSAAEYNRLYGLDEYEIETRNWRTGDSFLPSQRDRDASWYQDTNSDMASSIPDDVQDIVSQMNGIPFEQWADFLADWEINMVDPWMTQIRREKIREERRTRRAENRRNERQKRHGKVTQYR